MTTDVEGRSEAATAEAQRPAELARADVVREQVRTRLLLPVLIPLVAILALAVLAINLSRVFLAGGKVGALIAATLITLAVLGGAALISSKPGLRTSSLTLIASSVVLVVIGAGLITLGAADDHEDHAAGYQEPAGEPDTVLEVTANGNLTFTPSDPSAPAGILEIDLIQAPGAGFHDFHFDDPQFSGFVLETPPGGPEAGKIEAAEGSYDFYCAVPGHRAAGMEGTLTVTAAADGAGADGDGAGTNGTDANGDASG